MYRETDCRSNQLSFTVLLIGLLLAGCAAVNENEQASQVHDLDIETIRQTVGVEGTEKDGRYKITIPQNDLDVTVDGFQIIPPMGLGSWVTFAPAPEGAVVMGDIVLQEEEVGPIEKVLANHPVAPTALHKHFLTEDPRVVYMHVGGQDSEEALAGAVRDVFDRIDILRGGHPAEASAETVENQLDTTRIADLLGYEGSMNRGVYKVTIGRPGVDLTARGGTVPVTTFMGFSTWASFQGTPEQAAVSGDFAMLAEEVEPVLQTLAEHDISAVALHNHMVTEEPRIFFVHYWSTGAAERLVRGLRDALDQTGIE